MCSIRHFMCVLMSLETFRINYEPRWLYLTIRQLAMVWSHGFTDVFLSICKNLRVPPSLIVVCFMATCFPKKAQVLYEKSNMYIPHWITILPIHPIYILLSWKHFIFRLLDTSYWLQKWKNIKQFILHLQLPEKEKYSSSFINPFLI